jgi:hypothetical protein
MNFAENVGLCRYGSSEPFKWIPPRKAEELLEKKLAQADPRDLVDGGLVAMIEEVPGDLGRLAASTGAIRGASCSYGGGTPARRSYSPAVAEVWPARTVVVDRECFELFDGRGQHVLDRNLSPGERLALSPAALDALAAHFAECTAAGAFPVGPSRLSGLGAAR